MESSYRAVKYCAQAKGWSLLSTQEFKVSAAALEHRIPSFGFHIREQDSPGQLDVNKLQEVGLKPGPDYGKLKAGKPVEFEGVLLKPEDFLGSPVVGREIVIFGDTCNSDQILGLTNSPDIFIHEATMENKFKEKCVEVGHSTPDMAADIALRARANLLVLFHLSPRYKDIGDILKKDDYSAETLLLEAQEYLKSNNSRMEVMVAEDLMEVIVPRKKS
ncbi:zinc phosphodiesterase ELAC protein 1 [Eurytemora carolleeae]|uniref:zinc phosphodiesterase ELAC protein 1 n=1 Tax=Eurytemora carolleeae TaxID=1294199 RepID=UPI000C78D28B|nr:zinc phosphodiesterase ELAC protein 1 [Eurytemora carolleeae]|eukprot:XP_023326918.1 zinc phosphodiesterase ELAC protein 1-like [Eurytemora affinis]